jgi:hypothetical protein
MKQVTFLFRVIILLLFFSCTRQSEVSKSRLTTGYYKTRNSQGNPEKRYILVQNDTIWDYKINSATNQLLDSARSSGIAFPKEIGKYSGTHYSFSKSTWDFNFQTIVFKFRPAMANLPNQLNTEFNLNLYLGRRLDKYRVSYHTNPLEPFKRKIDHFGYSFGLFTGLGKNPVNGSVTRNQISYNYDGVIWLKGVSAIVGNNNFTFGLGLGVDNLLDANRDVWVYNGKPWLGLQIGIKLR